MKFISSIFGSRGRGFRRFRATGRLFAGHAFALLALGLWGGCHSGTNGPAAGTTPLVVKAGPEVTLERRVEVGWYRRDDELSTEAERRDSRLRGRAGAVWVEIATHPEPAVAMRINREIRRVGGADWVLEVGPEIAVGRGAVALDRETEPRALIAGDVLSVEIEESRRPYLAAHWLLAIMVLHFDLRTGTPIALGDLLRPGGEAAAGLLRALETSEQVRETPGLLSGFDGVKSDTPFYIEGGTLQLCVKAIRGSFAGDSQAYVGLPLAEVRPLLNAAMLAKFEPASGQTAPR